MIHFCINSIEKSGHIAHYFSLHLLSHLHLISHTRHCQICILSPGIGSHINTWPPQGDTVRFQHSPRSNESHLQKSLSGVTVTFAHYQSLEWRSHTQAIFTVVVISSRRYCYTCSLSLLDYTVIFAHYLREEVHSQLYTESSWQNKHVIYYSLICDTLYTLCLEIP